MALPMLVGGAECGPSNPLQALSKRFDQDKGIQQVLVDIKTKVLLIVFEYRTSLVLVASVPQIK